MRFCNDNDHVTGRAITKPVMNKGEFIRSQCTIKQIRKLPVSQYPLQFLLHFPQKPSHK